MPTTKREDQIDQQYQDRLGSSRLRQAEEETGQNAGVNAGIDQLESYANDQNNSSNTLQRQEENSGSNDGFYNRNASPQREKRRFTFRSLKKKGPLAAIIGVLLGGVGGLSFLFAPGLAVVNMKEMLTEDLNDQLTAMDIRTTHVMRAKLSDMGRGVCSGSVQIKCKFKGMTDRQANKFRSAGIEVETADRAGPFGRKQITSMTFSDGTKVNNPAEARRLLASNQTVRSELRRAFNPKFAGFYDRVSAASFAKFKSSKNAKFVGSTPDEIDENFQSGLDGETGSIDSSPSDTPDEEKSDDEKNRSEQGDRIQNNEGGGAKGVFSDFARSGIGGTIRGVQVTGALDSACTVYNTSRAVAASAKVIRAAQLVPFALAFLNFADQVKAGTATPEQAEYVGNKLTSVDLEQKVINENSKDENDLVDNPYYRKNAFDSEGMRAAFYNDAPTLTAQASQFAIGGGLTGSLSNINTSIASAVGGKQNISRTCGVVQNPFVRTGSAAVGIVLGVFSGGTSLAISIGASVGVMLALPILESYLADMIAGKVVGKDTKGVDAGNAIFAGTAALQGDMAMSRGMKPLKKDELRSYLAEAQNIKQEYIAMETEDAKDTPLNIYNQYSFLGSLSRSVLPIATSGQSPTKTMSSVFSMIPRSLTSVTPSANAVGEFNSERFEKCDDPGYDELEIAADVFCNVRYGLSSEELRKDTDEVIDYMAANGFISLEDGSPQGEYDEWVKECTQRITGWGDSPEDEENGSTGELCMRESEKYSSFRVYTMDSSVLEAMEYDGPEQESGDSGLPSKDGWVWPVPDVKQMGILGYGKAGSRGIHKGIDIGESGGASLGKTVVAAHAGTVERVWGQGEGCGAYVSIKAEGTQYYAAYQHLDGGSIRVRDGDQVTAGQPIGAIGRQGGSTCGSSGFFHLHFSIESNPGMVSAYANPHPNGTIDPLSVLPR